MSLTTEKKFKRVFEKNQQENLLKTPLYNKLLEDIKAGDIFPAFRNNTIDFYYKGGNVFKFKNGKFSTHIKYASVLHGHDRPYINETELKGAKLITDFTTGYDRIKENCSLYSGVEAEGVSKLFSKSSYALQNPKIVIPNIVVLDIEVSLKALDDVEADTQENQSTQDRIDLLLYNKETKTLQFFEVKHFSNSEIWSEKGTNPDVVKQVKRYNEQLVKKHDGILDAYKEYVKAARKLFNISEDQLPDPEHLADEVILLVFGFDSHQKIKINELLIKDNSLVEISRRFLGNLSSASEVWNEKTIKKSMIKIDKILEKARQLFQKAGFDLPAIPEKLAVRLEKRTDLDFSTRELPESVNYIDFYVDEANECQVDDYVILSRAIWSPSVNTIHYFLVLGPLRMFLQLCWGGTYITDDDFATEIREIRECFLLADQIVPLAMAVCKATDRLTIVTQSLGSNNYWEAPGQDAREIERRCHRPKDVLGEVLQWLRSSVGDGINFMEDVLKLAEEMDGKEREEFLAMAEQIDREEEFEQRKILYLSDYRKRLGKK
jgi:hypothetical protein